MAVGAAFRLRPDAGEAHFARAGHLCHGYLDYDGALAELEIAIKLPPADCHFVAICRIHCNRRFVRGVPDDVVPLRIDVDLIASEGPIRRDHPWRSPQPVDIGRRHVVFFQGLVRI